MPQKTWKTSKASDTSSLCPVSSNENNGKVTEFDEYLTNIKWLGQLSCSNLIPELKTTSPQVKIVKKRRTKSKERPPKSYSEIIQLAINSAPTKKMTLRQIYTWVEDHFPYYRHSAKPGWKNSIRHTLSMRNMFVRVTEEIEKTSFWTMKNHPDSNRLQMKKCREDSRKKEMNEKKIKPILPSGFPSVLIPVSIIPPVSNNIAPRQQCSKKKPIPIAPKLPLLLLSANVCVKDCLCTVNEHSVKNSTWKDAEGQTIVAKRWRPYSAQPPGPRRKKHKLGSENRIRHSAFDANLDTTGSRSSSKIIQSNGVDHANSPLKIPSKVATVEGLSTSTPCKDDMSDRSPTSMLISLLSGLTPPKLEDTAFNFSLLKTPSDGSPRYVSLASPDNTAMLGREDNYKDLCGLLGCTPLQSDSFIERPGVDEPNESFSKLFSEFCTPNLGEGIDLANISWSYIYNQN